MLKKIYVINLFMILSFCIFAQETIVNDGYCGTVFDEATTQKLRSYQKEIRKSGFRSPEDVYFIPIIFHMINEDNGGGAPSIDFAFARFCELNEQFAPSNIQFYLPSLANGFDYSINNTAFSNGGTGQAITMPNTHNDPSAVNAYIVNEANYQGTPDGIVCGYYSPGVDMVVVGQGCWLPEGTTMMHELGHFFTMPHTFGNASSYECGENGLFNWERADGSNCATSGDGFCDTGADYLSGRWTCNSNGLSNCLHKDFDGEIFSPEGWNPMSYANDDCVTVFSDEQTAAMKMDMDSRGLTNLTVSFDPIIEEVNKTAPLAGETTPFDLVYFAWDAVPNATGYIFEVNRTPIFVPTFRVENELLLTNDFTSYSLTPNTTYYWRVRPLNEAYTCADWSDSGTFTTGDFALSNENILEELDAIILNSNPNKIGEAINFDLSVNQSTDLLVRLISSDGKTVYEQNEKVSLGNQNIQIATDYLAPGLYFISLTSGKGQHQEKIILF